MTLKRDLDLIGEGATKLKLIFLPVVEKTLYGFEEVCTLGLAH